MIEVWQNKETGAPSIQVGSITMDLGKKETESQATLFALVMNHPDAVASGAVRAPLTPEIIAAFEKMIVESLRNMLPKRMGHVVQVHVD